MANAKQAPAAEPETTTQPTGTGKTKAKVLITFRDKNTRAICKKGSTLDLSPERLKELTEKKAYVREVKG